MKKVMLPIGAMFLAAIVFSACDLRPRESSITLSAEPYRVGQPITITPLDRDGNTVASFRAWINRIPDSGSGNNRPYGSGTVNDSKLVYYPPIDGTYKIDVELNVTKSRTATVNVVVPKGTSPSYAVLADLNGRWLYKFKDNKSQYIDLELYFAALSESSPQAEDWSMGAFYKDSGGTAHALGYIVYDAASTYCRLYLWDDETHYYRTDFATEIDIHNIKNFVEKGFHYCELQPGATAPSDSDSYLTSPSYFRYCSRSEILYPRMLRVISGERSTIDAALADR